MIRDLASGPFRGFLYSDSVLESILVWFSTVEDMKTCICCKLHFKIFCIYVFLTTIFYCGLQLIFCK